MKRVFLPSVACDLFEGGQRWKTGRREDGACTGEGEERAGLIPLPAISNHEEAGGRRNRNKSTSSPGPSPRSKWWIGEIPGQGWQNGSKNSWGFCHVNTMKCLRFVWTTVLDCKKKHRATRRWKRPPKKPLHHVSRDKILRDSWSISATLARGFSDPPFWTRRRPWVRGWEINFKILCSIVNRKSRRVARTNKQCLLAGTGFKG